MMMISTSSRNGSWVLAAQRTLARYRAVANAFSLQPASGRCRGSAGMNRSSPCDRGALVEQHAHVYTSAHECDGYSDCASGEDELWRAGPERVLCAGTPALAQAGALRCAAWLALLAVSSVCCWGFSHRRRSARLFAPPFALPFLAGCCVGPVATLLLVAPAPWAAGGGGMLLEDRQCAAPFVLALGLTAALGGLTLQVWHTVRHTGQPLQVQMTTPSKSAATPVGVAVGVQVVATGFAVAIDPWRTRGVPDPLASGVRCACTSPATAAVIFSVHAFVVGTSAATRCYHQHRVLHEACSLCVLPTFPTGATLLLGVWLALGPGRAVAKQFRFYPWMQQCGAVTSAILVWFVCLAAAVASMARSDLPWSHLPTTYAIALAYNVAVLLSLPVLWLPKAAALTHALQAKHARVTTLHSLISGNTAPWCAASRPLPCHIRPAARCWWRSAMSTRSTVATTSTAAASAVLTGLSL
jgi:hypothetical protein